MTLEDITPAEFVFSRMSHDSAEKFFSSREIEISSYRSTDLSVSHAEYFNDNFPYHAELSLANRAIEEGCEFVTNIDYCQFKPEEGFMIVVGTGWMPR